MNFLEVEGSSVLNITVDIAFENGYKNIGYTQR